MKFFHFYVTIFLFFTLGCLAFFESEGYHVLFFDNDDNSSFSAMMYWDGEHWIFPMTDYSGFYMQHLNEMVNIESINNPKSQYLK